MRFDNHMKMRFLAKSANESFARSVVAAFASQMDPTIEEITDIKTAVSEAVTNSIIHGYDSNNEYVHIECYIKDNTLTVKISDKGKGIADVKQAMQPLFTTSPETERSGLGFTVMDTFMDSLDVESSIGNGTVVIMTKKIVQE